MGKIFLLIRTVKYLKLKQILYRLFYALRGKYRSFVRFKYKFNLYRKGKALAFVPMIDNNISYESNSFTFLNKSVAFNNGIDWDYDDNGKLWTYNLNYFDYLNQKSMTCEIGQALMYLFIDQIQTLKNANEPYTISLRGINWVKFLSKHNIEKKSLDRYLYSQYRILLDNLEYHILGNHLLENGFSLFFGGYYFKGNELYNKGKEILSIELREQILNDGAHFELSPMYHKIILHRLLDTINLIDNNTDVYEDDLFKDFLLSTAEKMLGWLEAVTLSNGETPRVNDSTENIAASSDELFKYAHRLKLKWSENTLQDSGYRKFNIAQTELFVDYGQIGPSYIPGHAHSDTFSFILNCAGKAIIVDPGISTYDTGYRRQRERSTSSHNTVRYEKLEQTEVWGAFRVGRRAKTFITEDTKTKVVGYHDGYKRFHVLHQRSFVIDNQNIIISDSMITNRKLMAKSSAYFHFHPDVKVTLSDSDVIIDNCDVSFSGASSMRLKEYTYAHGYNKTERAQVLEVLFKEELITKIKLKDCNNSHQLKQ